MSPWLSDLFLSSQSDQRLVELARAGQDRAFAAIVDRYRRALHGSARRLCSDGRAEDMVQQTFLSAYAALRAGAEVRHLRGWLHQILRNAVIQSAPPAELVTAPDSLEIATESAHHAAEARIRAAETLAGVAALPSRQHQALVAMAIQGRSRTEVAELMGLSEGAVRQLVHRARESLRGIATGIMPFPFIRALAASGPSSGVLPDVTVGVGSASAAGIAAKLGTLLASGVVATGVLSATSGPSSSGAGHGARRATVARVHVQRKHVATGPTAAAVLRTPSSASGRGAAARTRVLLATGSPHNGPHDGAGQRSGSDGSGRTSGRSGDGGHSGGGGGTSDGGGSGSGGSSSRGPGPGTGDGGGTVSGSTAAPPAPTQGSSNGGSGDGGSSGHGSGGGMSDGGGTDGGSGSGGSGSTAPVGTS